jgi:hypothetical protein
MVVDPNDPLARLRLSPVVDPDAILSNRPARLPEALLFTALRNDDRGGRDVLYPPPPGPRSCGSGVHAPDEDCEDDDACNGREVCDLGAATCRDRLPLSCDDGDPCNGVETCDPEAGCQAGVPCVDANLCTVDTCDPHAGCVHGFDTALCPVHGLGTPRLTTRRAGGRSRRRIVLVAPDPLPAPRPALPGAEALLLVSDAAGRSASFALPARGWRRIGRGGSERLVFRGRRGEPCRTVKLDLARGLRAVCRLPYPGMTMQPPVSVALRVGVPATGATFYCTGPDAAAPPADGSAPGCLRSEWLGTAVAGEELPLSQRERRVARSTHRTS